MSRPCAGQPGTRTGATRSTRSPPTRAGQPRASCGRCPTRTAPRPHARGNELDRLSTLGAFRVPPNRAEKTGPTISRKPMIDVPRRRAGQKGYPANPAGRRGSPPAGGAGRVPRDGNRNATHRCGKARACCRRMRRGAPSGTLSTEHATVSNVAAAATCAGTRLATHADATVQASAQALLLGRQGGVCDGGPWSRPDPKDDPSQPERFGHGLRSAAASARPLPKRDPCPCPPEPGGLGPMVSRLGGHRHDATHPVDYPIALVTGRRRASSTVAGGPQTLAMPFCASWAGLARGSAPSAAIGTMRHAPSNIGRPCHRAKACVWHRRGQPQTLVMPFRARWAGLARGSASSAEIGILRTPWGTCPVVPWVKPRGGHAGGGLSNAIHAPVVDFGDPGPRASAIFGHRHPVIGQGNRAPMP